MKIHITETVLRDANQSLMATRLPMEDFAGILDTIDQAGYHSIECWGGATFDSCLRYLTEGPVGAPAHDQKTHEEYQAANAAARSESARLPSLF